MKKYLSLLLLSFIVSPLYAQVDLQDGLVAYYPFAETLRDESGHGKHGVHVGDAQPRKDRDGLENNAYEFDGDDFVRVNAGLQELNIPFSTSFWVFKPSGIETENRAILATSDNPSNYFGFFMNLLTDNTISIHYGNGGLPGPTSRRGLESKVSIPDDAWVHVTAVVKGESDITLYFDGEDAGGELVGTGGTTMVNTANPLTIGEYDLGVDAIPFLGGIDDVRFYDRALTEDEIAALFELTPDVFSDKKNIMISEIMKNPDDVSDSFGEWIELFNISDETVDLNGWAIRDLGSENHVINAGDPLLIEPHTAIVLCKNPNEELNGDVPCDYQYTNIALDNKDDAVLLMDDGGLEADRVVYDNGNVFPSPTGASLLFTGDAETDNNTGNNWIAAFERAAGFQNDDCTECDDLGSPGTVEGGTLPVELVDFDVVIDGKDALVRWSTASETNNAGFEVHYRSRNDSYEQVGWVSGMGTTQKRQNYAYRMNDVGPGLHTFRIKQVDFDGTFTMSKAVEREVQLQESHFIRAPYPNPFNPNTTISFSVQQDQKVTVDLVNVLGQKMVTAFDNTATANQQYVVNVNGAGLASGRYFVRVKGATFFKTYQVYLVK